MEMKATTSVLIGAVVFLRLATAHADAPDALTSTSHANPLQAWPQAPTLTVASTGAYAQENTAAACRDRVDNDRDGFIDCADQDCSLFSFCQGSAPRLGGSSLNRRLSTGWSLAGGILGFVGAGLVLSAGITSEVLNPIWPDSLIAGAATTILFSTLVPIVQAAGRSARLTSGVQGCIGCRVGAWVTYGLALSGAAVLLAMGVNQLEVPTGPIISTTLLGTTSLIMFAIDSLVARSQVLRKSASSTSLRRTKRWDIVPYFGPVASGNNLTGGVIGITLVR